jgi:hypothetical protein
MARRIQLRRDTASNWSSTNPTLAQGEIGIDLTNNKIKIGNGTTLWNNLAYFDDSETVLSNYAGHIIPSTDNTYDLGAPDKQWRDIFVSEGSIYIGDIKLSNDNGTLLVQQVTDAGLVTEEPIEGSTGVVTTDRLTVGEVELVLTGGANPYVTFPAITGGDQLFIQGSEIASASGNLALTSRGNAYVIANAAGVNSVNWIFNTSGTIETSTLFPRSFTATCDNNHSVAQSDNDEWNITGDPWYFEVEFGELVDGSQIEVSITNNTPWAENPGYVNGRQFQFGPADHGIPGYTFTLTLTNIQNPGMFMYTTNLAASQAPSVPATLSATTSVKLKAGNNSLVFGLDGNLYLPTGGDILDSNGQSVLGGSGTGPVQPYLQVTNTPLIVQPAVLGTPVTVTVPLSGQGAQFTVVIENTGTTMSSGVTTAGTGYVVGQIYKIYYYQVGGSDASSDITITITEVNETGGIVSYDVLWSGPNVDGTYQFVSIDYQPGSVIDTISPEVVLTRGAQQGIYNTALELEYDNNTYLSPLGTEWNSDGWGNLTELGTRTYTTWRQALNNAVGNNIVASELVMRDIANDRYYKFDFHTWGGSNDGYSYTRTEVTDLNYYRKPHNAESADIVIEDDPTGTGIVIGRTDSTGIYNLAQEVGFVANSPAGTTWNADGWDDLSNIATRTYQVFDLAANGYNSVLGKKFVMNVASANKYYAIQFYEWATNGNNNFAYVRYEIDQTKLNEGITFPDGTKLKSAAGVGRIKSTAVGDRRIEEVTGYNSVSVTARTTNDYTGASARTTTTNYEIFVKRTPALDAVIIPLTTSGNNFTVQISFDGVTYLPSWLSSVQETEYWFYYENSNAYVPQTEDNPVYLRFTSGADPQIWWNKATLPGGEQDFRGAIIDYHAYTGESTIIGTIHIVRDSGEEHISHQEVQSGSTDGENDDLWLVQNEGTVSYRRIDGESKTLKIHWTAKVFYGSEFWD